MTTPTPNEPVLDELDYILKELTNQYAHRTSHYEDGSKVVYTFTVRAKDIPKAKAALHRLILKERLKQLGTVSQSQVLDSRCSCCNVNGDALRNRIAQLDAEIEGSNHD